MLLKPFSVAPFKVIYCGVKSALVLPTADDGAADRRRLFLGVPPMCKATERAPRLSDTSDDELSNFIGPFWTCLGIGYIICPTVEHLISST